MLGDSPERPRVAYGPGGMAYKPGEMLVREEVSELALGALAERFPEARLLSSELGGGWTKVQGVPDLGEAWDELRSFGIFGQPNHVLFATGCCPPHPSSEAYGANPFLAHPFLANPFLAHSVTANPFLAHPFLAHPFLAHGSGGSCCCCGETTASPFLANPFLAHATPNPALYPRLQGNARQKSSARPAQAPKGAYADSNAGAEVRVAILDTGYAQSHQPTGLPKMNYKSKGGDHPDEDGDQYLDPVAGHGTFIAGIIEQMAPGCLIQLYEVLSTHGDGAEDEIAQQLMALAALDDDERPHLVNLSFGGYSPVGMGFLADAIKRLDHLGVVVVASAGNDATCMPTYPSVLPEVIGVGALDEDGWPAEYTNYGPWVRASTRGTDVVSLFFEGYDGAEPVTDGVDPDAFEGWAKWSGTSFAAPRVVATLAAEMQSGISGPDAVQRLIDGEKLPRHPMLGTLVNP